MNHLNSQELIIFFLIKIFPLLGNNSSKLSFKNSNLSFRALDVKQINIIDMDNKINLIFSDTTAKCVYCSLPNILSERTNVTKQKRIISIEIREKVKYFFCFLIIIKLASNSLKHLIKLLHTFLLQIEKKYC